MYVYSVVSPWKIAASGIGSRKSERRQLMYTCNYCLEGQFSVEKCILFTRICPVENGMQAGRCTKCKQKK